MTMWFQIPQMLASQPDEELARMKAVCRMHRKKFERGPEQERVDADVLFAMISREQRRRLIAPTIVPRIP
jgi:hypothetical protein